MKNPIILIIILLSITVCSYAQNFSKENNHRYSYSITLLDSTYDSKLDKKLSKYVDKKRKMLQKQMNVVIAHSETELESYPLESPLSNFLTDLLLKKSPEYIDNEAFTNIDVSILNFGGIRTSMPAGDVTIGDIYSISPFDNHITFILLKGSELKKVFSRFTESLNAAYSGLQISFKNGNVVDISIKDKEIDDEAIYKLVTLDFISAGGDHILEDINFEEIEYTNSTFREFLIIELSSMKENKVIIRSTVDGRAKKL